MIGCKVISMPCQMRLATRMNNDRWREKNEMTDVALASYFIRVTLWSQGTEDEKRDEILSSAWKVITLLTPKTA